MKGTKQWKTNEHILCEASMTDKKYNRIIVELLKELDKEPDIDLSDKVEELMKRLKL